MAAERNATILALGTGYFSAASPVGPFEAIEMPTTIPELIELGYQQRAQYFETHPSVLEAVRFVAADLGRAQLEVLLENALAARIAPAEYSPILERPKLGTFQINSEAIRPEQRDPEQGIEEYSTWLEERGGLLRDTRLEGICWVRSCEAHIACEEETAIRRSAFRNRFEAAILTRLNEIADKRRILFDQEKIGKHATNAVNNFFREFCDNDSPDRYSGLSHLEELLVSTFASRHIDDMRYRLSFASLDYLRKHYFYHDCLDAIETTLFVRNYHGVVRPAVDTIQYNKKQLGDRVAQCIASARGLDVQEFKLTPSDKQILWEAAEKIQTHVLPNLLQGDEDFDREDPGIRPDREVEIREQQKKKDEKKTKKSEGTNPDD